MPRKAKPNRTDLNVPKVTVPGQDYGKQAAQAQAMKVVPMARQEMAPAQMAAQAAQAPQGKPLVPVEAPDLSQLKYLHPTEEPHLPMTHGLSVGPGAGPEAMGPFGGSLSHTLTSLAQGPYGSPQLSQVADLIHQAGL